MIAAIFQKISTPASLVISMGLHASCAPVPDLVPRVANVEIADQVNEANLIVVGLAENERVVRPVAGTRETGPLNLLAVIVRVEGVLKGHFDGERLTFYYYQMTGGAWDGPAPNIVAPGQRSIFYLMNDGGVIRAATDAYLSHTNLATGKHPISPAANDSSTREAVAELVLLPGEGMDMADYLGSLHRGKALALALVGKSQVRQMLRGLLKNPQGAIRGRACITLAEFPLNEKGCLQDVIGDVQSLPEDRKRAEELMRTPKL